MMRVAELLKTLCYIDLSRSQLNDCEVKLEGLEHILNIETFQSSSSSSSSSYSIKTEPGVSAVRGSSSATLPVTPAKIIDPVRDMAQLDTSPLLSKRVFDPPKFIDHVNCDCYKCVNAAYKYAVFAATYIRAQLYALRDYNGAAANHFHGAFRIKRDLFAGFAEESPARTGISRQTDARRFSWQARFYITDYVQLLIDFCYFLKVKTTRQQEALGLINLAINTCRKHGLEGRPVYVSAGELALDINFQSTLESPDCLRTYFSSIFYVSAIEDAEEIQSEISNRENLSQSIFK